MLRVNDRIATLHDYEQAKLERIRALRDVDLPRSELQQAIADVGVDTMSDLFEELLLLARADQLGLDPSPEELRDAVLQMKENAGIESDEEFERAMAASGFTPESFREHVTKNLMMSGVMGREVRPRVRLEEEDLRRYYGTHLDEFQTPVRLQLREVVILEDGGGSPEERLAMAEHVRERIASPDGADELITDYSQQGLSTPWIELGWIDVPDLDAAIAEAVRDLQPGEVSEPVEARGGLHVCQVLDRQDAGVKEFAEVRDEIERRLTDRRFREEIGDYLADLERSSYVVINPPPEAAGFRSVLERRAATEGPTERELALGSGALEAPSEAATESEPQDSEPQADAAADPPPSG